MHKMPDQFLPAASDATSGGGWDGDEEQEQDFKPLTRQEAQQWRERQPAVSAWSLVRLQVLVGLLVALSAGLLTWRAPVAWSVLYGAAAVALPSALMAYGLTSSAVSRLMGGVAQAAFAGFLLWEGVKILVAVAMLWLAPFLIPELSWLGLLAGLVLTLKVYWFGFWIQARRSKQNG
jgi:ATP synthase protein I